MFKKLFLFVGLFFGVIVGCANADVIEKKLHTDYRSTQVKSENKTFSKLILEYFTNELKQAEFIFIDSKGNIEFKLKCVTDDHYRELICKY